MASILSESDNNDAFGDGSWYSTHGSMWIGLTDSETENTFVWDDGEAFNFAKWESGQPNNWQEQDCVIFTNSNGEWQDCSCDGVDDCTPKAFVCNKIGMIFVWACGLCSVVFFVFFCFFLVFFFFFLILKNHSLERLFCLLFAVLFVVIVVVYCVVMCERL